MITKKQSTVGRLKLQFSKEDYQQMLLKLTDFKNRYNFFTQEELARILKSFNFPFNQYIFKSFKDRGYIERISRSSYTFTPKRMEWSMFSFILQDYQEINKQNNKRYYISKKSEELEIQKSIQLLKRNGYVIYKQV